MLNIQDNNFVDDRLNIQDISQLTTNASSCRNVILFLLRFKK